MTYLIVAGLASWFTLSVIAQLRGGRFRRLQVILFWARRFDVFSIIPTWTFFAPNPGTKDFHVLYRDRLIDGGYTTWKSIAVPSSPYYRYVWNPNKRKTKAVTDLSSFLMREVRLHLKDGVLSKGIYVTISYVMIATSVSSAPHSPFSDMTQFLVAMSYGFETGHPADISFISPLFSLQKNQPAS